MPIRENIDGQRYDIFYGRSFDKVGEKNKVRYVRLDLNRGQTTSAEPNANGLARLLEQFGVDASGDREILLDKSPGCETDGDAGLTHYYLPFSKEMRLLLFTLLRDKRSLLKSWI